MNRSRLSQGCFLGPLAIVGTLGACSAPEPSPPPPPPAPPPVAAPPAAAGRPPRATDGEALRQARRHLEGGGREETCGPYRLWTDVAGAEAVELCRKLAAPLDITYQHRYGLRPRGEPAEGIFLFEKAEDFRAFARQRGRLRLGYAGFSDSSKGFVALAADRPSIELARTLAHELTHLVSRRALGPGLSPWLSEGLADGIGDAAGVDGLGPLQGIRGVEGPAERLSSAFSLGRVPSLERLVALRRDQFDGGIVSYDYEQSALFVRYLLLDGELGPRFRDLLARMAQGERYSPELVRSCLGRSWAQLDDGMETWLAPLP